MKILYYWVYISISKMIKKDKDFLIKSYWKYVVETLSNPDFETMKGVAIPFLGKFKFNAEQLKKKHERNKSNKKNQTDV